MELLSYLKKHGIDYKLKNDNLSVGGYLNLYGTPITSLPDNLSVKVRKGSIKIGCEWKGKLEWKEFFNNKNFIETNPNSNPEDYNLIAQDFKQAVLVQKKLFKK